MKRMGLIVFFIFFIGFLFGMATFIQTNPQRKNQDVKSAIVIVSPTQKISPTYSLKKDLHQIVKVIDGDTISVNIDGKVETIRLIGIDSPESVDPRKKIECFGKEASDKAKQILGGRKVSLESDWTQGDKDKYKRLLRYVFLEDGENFNKLMIRSGYAHEYTYSTSYEYQTEFKTAEDKAREEGKGLWAQDACVGSSQGPIPTVNMDNDSNFSCTGKTTCSQMVNCDEAYFYLNNCRVSRLDGDKDGVPCEILCR